jgi:hypothetical protein
MAHAPIGGRSIGVVRKAKQLLGLLLLESTHLILEYLALEKTLTLVLETLELNTGISQVEESRWTLFPLLRGRVIIGRWIYRVLESVIHFKGGNMAGDFSVAVKDRKQSEGRKKAKTRNLLAQGMLEADFEARLVGLLLQCGG